MEVRCSSLNEVRDNIDSKKYRRNRKPGHFSPSNAYFCPVRGTLQATFPALPAHLSCNDYCLCTIYRCDNANSVTCWAVFFTKLRKRTLV